MDPDVRLRWGVRLAAVGALAAFVFWLFNPPLPFLLLAVGLGVLAYLLLRLEVRRHPAYPEPLPHRPVTDDEEDIEDVVPAVSMVGIPLRYERKTTRVRKGGPPSAP